MQYVRVIGLKADAAGVLEELQNLGVLEISKPQHSALETGKPLDISDEILAQLTRIRGIKNSLVPFEFKAQVSLDALAALEEAKKITIDGDIVALNDRLDRAKKREEEIKEELKSLAAVKPLHIDYSMLDFNILDFRLGKIRAENLSRLLSLVSHSTSHYEYISAPAGASLLVLFAFKKGEHVSESLSKAGFEELAIPRLSGTVAGRMGQLEAELGRIVDEKKAIEQDKVKLSREYWPKIAVLNEALKIEADKADAARRLGNTASTFTLEGWVVSSAYHKVESHLKSRFKNILVSRIETSKEPPTEFQNPPLTSPFQFLVDFMAVPKSDEIEPSSILALTFPLIYGMIIGDVIYGLISLALALYMVKKTNPGVIHSIGQMLAIAAIPSVIFGFVFDEWFGFSFEHFMRLFGVAVHGTFLSLFGIDLVLHRLEGLTILIVFTVFVGILHLCFGFVLGFFNNLRHDIWHAMAKLGWIGLIASGVILVPKLLFKTNLLPLGDPFIVGGALGLLGLALIYKAEGFIGMFEIPGVLGNIMSYTRIAAVGLVGVIIAEKIINEMVVGQIMAGMTNPILLLVMGIVVVILHMLNLGLAMFESLIHGARLNMVEFYGKFFHGGGKKFVPFSAARHFTRHKRAHGAND
ncbi:MAG: V-type ATPase 116kDa subunit family protein [Candidatus Micrarchaeia archaeon]